MKQYFARPDHATANCLYIHHITLYSDNNMILILLLVVQCVQYNIPQHFDPVTIFSKPMLRKSLGTSI